MNPLPPADLSVLARHADDAKIQFEGPPEACARLFGVARVMLGVLRHRLALGGIEVGSRHVRTPGGGHIFVAWDGTSNIIRIRAPGPTTPGEEDNDSIVYEFAMQFSVPDLAKCEFVWVVVRFRRNGFWTAESYPGQTHFLLASLEANGGDSIISSPFDDLQIYGASKAEANVWHSGDRRYQRRLAWGGGNICYAPRIAHRYGNYFLSTGYKIGMHEVYWYDFVGRDRLAGAPLEFGVHEPIAEGFDASRRYRVSIDLRGRVTVIRRSDGAIKKAEGKFPEWVKGTSLDLNHVGGAWHLNGDCTKAISVLHGNAFPPDALLPGFDVGRLSDPNEPAEYSGAFQSGVFVVNIGITGPAPGRSGDFELVVSVEQIGETSMVMTCGLAYGYPEMHSKGDYYVAADFDETGAIVTASIHYYRRTSTEGLRKAVLTGVPTVELKDLKEEYPPLVLSGLDVDESLPLKYHAYGTAAHIYRVEPSTPGRSYFYVGFAAPYWQEVCFVREFSTVELRFSNSEKIVPLYRSGSITTYRGSQLLTGGDLYEAENSHGPDIVLDYACLLEGRPRTGVPGASVFPTAPIFSQGSEERYDIVTQHLPTVVSRIGNFDARAKTVFYTSAVEQSSDHGSEAYLRFAIGALVESHGLKTFPSKVVVETAHCLNPFKDHQVETNRTEIAAPNSTNELVTGMAISNDYANYPPVVKLWQTMVMGCENPKTPDDFGGVKGYFFDYADYFPNQSCGAPNSINWHPNGFHGTYGNGFDKVYCFFLDKKTGVKKEIATTHQAIIDRLIERGPDKIAQYVKQHPGTSESDAARATGALTPERLAKIRQHSITNRGEWIY